jgi:hypothetical protein
MEIKMTSYRTLMLAGTFLFGATAAYADDGRMDIQLRDEGLIHSDSGVYEPAAPMFEGRASVNEPAPYAYEGGSTSEQVPIDVRRQDITTEGNDNN